jgi:type I restriction enzyme S subunit
MSSKRKPPTATNDESALAPKLRFPEFFGHPVKDLQLADVTAECTERRGAGQTESQIMGVSKVDGIVPMEDRLIAADTARYKLVRKDWFAYNPMRLNIGSIARWEGDNAILVSPDYVVFRCKSDGPNKLEPGYLDHYRRSDAWDEFVSEKGDGSVRVRIYYKDLARLHLALPSFHEQQKIADCLDSASALIAGQARKVDALKAHKKGLMQQLFPREGETQPRLRFPEFQHVGDWKEDTIEEMISTISPPKKLQTADYQSAGEFPIVDQSQDYICGWTNDHEAVVFEGLPVIVFGDHTCALKFIDRPFVQGADGIKIFRPTRGIDVRFLFCALEANPVAQESYKRHFSLLKEKTLSFPDPKSGEQQRIADCFTSLDDLISVETQKLDALKTHKRGLMQQLFPSHKEAEA